MIFIRDNSMPDINIVQLEMAEDKKDKFSKKDKWQHMPQLMANELAQKSRNSYPHISLSFEKKASTQDVTYKKSYYNISKKYDDGDMILLNTATEAVVILQEEEVGYYESFVEGKAESEFEKILIDLGFLVKTGNDERYIFDILRNQFAYKSDKCVNITIYPTQACNARCFYCFEQKEQKYWMTEETADEVVDYITRTLSVDNELVFRWFGGEPLLGEKIIDRIITGVDDFFEGRLVYHSIIITNNSLITDDLIEKFKTIWHVRKVQTTIDGYREEHDRRKAYVDSSVDRYCQTINNIRKLLDAGIFTICRFNFDKYNMSQFEPVLEDLKEFVDNPKFFVHATTLRNKIYGEEEARNRYIYPSDYPEFYTYVLGQLFEKGFYKDVINILPIRARNVCLACTIGGLIINSEGKFFRCLQHYLDEENCVGDCTIGLLHNEAYQKWFEMMNNMPEECRVCEYLPCCQGGCKHYRMENKPEASPCLREKFYIDVILDLVHKYVK